jgi:F-type H+-transporting ATPase subunit alpha
LQQIFGIVKELYRDYCNKGTIIGLRWWNIFIVIVLVVRNKNGMLFIRAPRSSLRWKVNDSVITGMCLADALLPIGSGQRQLIIGDRFIGKTSIYLTLVCVSVVFSYIVGMDGLGSRRLYAIYIGIGQSLTKILNIINLCKSSIFFNVICAHSSFNAIISLLSVFVGIVLAEKLKLKGFNSVLCFDDINAHAKSYRQISLVLAKIPSRDAYPADIFNIHSGLLERICKVSISVGGSITGLPIIELQNSNITDYIATNIISITDGQFYMSTKLFISSMRPAFDTGLSVSRIGSAAQLK